MGKNYRILIIDDSKETVDGLGSFFRDKYDVVAAYNGLDGIKEFDNSDGCVDLAITDLVMPDISGIGVISVIKKIPRTAHHCNDRLGRAPRRTGKRCKSGYGFE
jgi:response regulator RpfG family c-di-GMP phosphodiesterase